MKKYDGSLKRCKDTSKLKDETFKLLNFLITSIGFIHNQGIIHRDLKPQNILVSSDIYKLADFGIAKYDPNIFDLLPKTKEDERLSNYLFSAPEQLIKEGKVSKASDIYAIGQLIQWFVTGETHRGTARKRISEILGVSDDVSLIDQVVNKCLIHDQNQRFQSCDEIKSFLNEKKETNPWEPIYSFAHIFRKTFPKIGSGFVYSDDSNQFTRLFKNINSENFKDNIVWFDGTSDDSIKGKIEDVGNGIGY